MNKYDNDEFSMHNNDGLKLQIINDNFTEKDISDTIDSLKNNKSPGNDLLPAELIKACKAELLPLITEALNNIINNRDFPDIWAEGLRSPVFKTGDINNRNNYRGIMVLSVFTKNFETTVNNRLNFVTTAYDSGDRFNGVFTKGRMTSDNIFILQGLIERQMTLGQPLYLCMVDFSKAFDLVNRNILFFKLIKSGIHGKVVDALRSLYRKTYFRLNHHGLLSPPTRDTHGVNQGGNTSPTLFRHYMSDLGEFLHQKCSLCISSDIIAHLLWADDLVLVSDSKTGLQKQLDGIFSFCEKNLMIVNELKTKVITFGCNPDLELFFKNQKIETTSQYKYLGNIISGTSSLKSDILRENYN